MATYSVRINGVDRADTHVLMDGFQINEVTNGINTLVCEVESEDASFRPVKRQSIEVDEDDGTSPVRTIFGGLIKSVRERGFGQPADTIDSIVMAVTADSYKQLAERRFVTETFAGGTLKAALQLLEPYLNTAPYFVTLDPAQVNGPTLDAIEWKVVRVDDCLNFLATLTAKYGAPFTWDISYEKILGMYQTGTVAAPWNLIEGDGTETGDVEVEPTDDEYANKIIVVWGSGNVIDLGPDGLNTPETFTGNGVTNSFPLTYQLVGPIPPPPLTSPPTASAIGYAYVNVPGGLIEFLGNTGTFGAEWEYDQVTNSVSRVAGPPPLGYVFTVPYRGLLTGTVVAQDAAEIAANGLWEEKILAPEIEDPVLALSVAEAELARRINTGRIVRFRTRRIPCVRPGETITITVPKRNISGSFTVTDVATANEPGGALDDLSPSDENNLIRTVTCNSSIHEQAHQTLTRWWSEKDHAGIAQSAGASAVPDWPLNSVQFNDNWEFGGAAHVLYGDLFWSQPDPGEVQSKGLVFVQNQDLGEPGHIGLTDPQRLEMGMIGEGDFSMDIFGVDASILINASGDIVITAGVPEGSPIGSPGEGLAGGVHLVGNESISENVAALSGIQPGVSTNPGDIGDSFSRFTKLNVIDGVAGFYRTVSSLPFSIQISLNEDTVEVLTYFVTAGSGTIFLPWIGSAGTPNYRSFPVTSVGRMYWIVNDGGGTLTVDAGTAGTNINDASSITLADKAAVKVQRHDDGWRILSQFGTVTGGGGGSALTIGGNDKDVQFNDGGVLGGEDAFEYDKTKDQLQLTRFAGTNYSTLRITETNGDSAVMGLHSFNDQLQSDITFGWERVNNVDTARTYAPGWFYWYNAGGSGVSPAGDEIGFEIVPAEDPGSPMAFALGRGFKVSADGIGSLYQYGGLGNGGFTGMGLEIDRNSDDQGAAAYLSLQDKGGTRYYQWNDDAGQPRFGSAPPQEDGSPGDVTGGLAFFLGGLIVKDADESVANDTLQDDDDLFFAVEANAVYVVEVTLYVTTAASNVPDIKTAWTLPASATITISQLMYDSGATGVTTLSIGHRYQNTTPSTAQPAGVLTSASQPASSVIQHAVIRTGATAGTAQLQWAQNTTTGGTPTVVETDSYLRYHKRIE